MNAITLSQLSYQIEEALQTEMDVSYWVQAEIASLSERGGHAYLDLIENAPSGQLAAKLRATCWANIWAQIKPYFIQETGNVLQIGMQILIEVEVNYHALYGLSLNIIDIDPTYTIGDMARQRQLTIHRLQQEGVFDMQRSLSLATLPHRLAIVSSHQAAGYEDFEHQLQQSGYALSTTLFPATMQGDHAPASIIQALKQIADQYEHFDAVIIIRGGGANTDLSCFDDYNLATHCAQFPLPIITGIGHTKDISITDMVAYMSLKTPTAVAAWLIDAYVKQEERITQLRHSLSQTVQRQIMLRRHRIEMLQQSLLMQSPERIYHKGYSLLIAGGRIVQHTSDVQAGEQITTHLIDGTITSIVQ